MPGPQFDADVVIVTGAGRGIGRAHALVLARAGARVVVNDHDADAADGVVHAIESAGGSATASHASVSTPDGARAIIDVALRRFGTIDGLINNAGTSANGLFEDITPAMLDDMLDVHVRGAFFVTQQAWPTMRDKGYGRVVLTSSSLAMYPSSGNANYATAKAALHGLCMTLSYEGRPHGILVNLLLPRAATTISARAPAPGLVEGLPPGLRDALAPRRMPEAVAPFAAYLVSAACTLSGEAFSVGNGHFARLFVGACRGWAAPDPASITIDDVAAHIDQIRDVAEHIIPKVFYDEIRAIAETIGLEYG